MTDSECVDVHFALSGRAVPLDYADALWQALRARLPWLEEEPLAGIHPLGGLSPGEACWYLSRRSQLRLRLPRARVAQAESLAGGELSLGGETLSIGAASCRELLAMPVLYAKFVAFGAPSGPAMAEEEFHAHCRRELAAMDMHPRMICGKAQTLQTAAGAVSGFSLMLFDLDPEQNLRLQARGLGGERKRGCGIFVPHKSIAAVATLE